MTDTPDPDDVLGAAEAARFLGIDTATLLRWGNTGRITYMEISGSRYRRYRVRDLLPHRPRIVNPPDPTP